MADSLYFSLWFSDFSTEEVLVRTLSVMRQFPFSRDLPGITYFALHPVSWNEPTILEQRFRPGASPEEAILIASDLLHEDYAYAFEANWDLWTPDVAAGKDEQWTLRPSPVSLIVRGEEFEEGESKTQGEVQLDFGLDTPFLYEEFNLQMRSNRGCGPTCRCWWTLSIVSKKAGSPAPGCCGRSRTRTWRRSWSTGCRECSS